MDKNLGEQYRQKINLMQQKTKHKKTEKRLIKIKATCSKKYTCDQKNRHNIQH